MNIGPNNEIVKWLLPLAGELHIAIFSQLKLSNDSFNSCIISNQAIYPYTRVWFYPDPQTTLDYGTIVYKQDHMDVSFACARTRYNLRYSEPKAVDIIVKSFLDVLPEMGKVS